jgi:N-acetylglucosaminyldiphosphoundecaprenol N-acetyl-beta-D-mannosaminyltransferase
MKDAHPDILVLGMGVPFQEKWMSEHAQSLEVPVIWAVGGLFDYLCGRWKRGPRILSDHGFEWVSRLCSEPRRLWKRYLIGNSKFAWYILKGALLDGRRR